MPAAMSGAGAGAPAKAAAGSTGAPGGMAGSVASAAGSTGAAGSTTGAAGSAGAAASPMAIAMLEPLASAGAAYTLSGTATFSKASFGVNLNISVMHCTDGKSYPVHIHEGSSCTDATTQGGHWGADMPAAGSGGAGGAAASGAAGSGTGAGGAAAGGAAGSSTGAGGASGRGTGAGPTAAGSGGSATGGAGGTSQAGSAAQAGAGGAQPAAGSGGTPAATMTLKARGEGIPDIVCTGDVGTSMHTRSTPDPRTTWSIGGDERSNVVGHVLVVHDGATRIACGKITLQ
jgi:hypothetical protein